MADHENKILKGIKRIFGRSETAVLIATILLIIVFAISSDSFLTPYNIFNMSRTAAIYMFIALGQAVVLIVGGMNLALGQMGGLSVIIAGYFMDVHGFPSIAGILIGLTVGVLCGLLNSFIMIKLKLSAFITTLAMQFVYAGLITGICEGFPYTNIPANFSIVGTKGFGSAVPYLIVLAAATLILLWYIFRYTVIGRRLLATGGNIEAARLSGINTEKMLMISHMASGFFAAIAGLLWLSRMGAAQPTTGEGWMLVSFAVAVIGGTGLSGGVINPLAMFVSGYLLVMIRNGLVMMQANVYFEQTYLGIIILVAVSLDSLRALLAEKRLKHALKRK